MNTVHRKRYTTEFKVQAIELLGTGKPVSQVAEELCISSNLLYSWRHGAQPGSAGARAPQASAPKRTGCATRSNPTTTPTENTPPSDTKPRLFRGPH